MIQSVVVLFLSKCSQFRLLVQFLHVLIQVPSFFDYHHCMRDWERCCSWEWLLPLRDQESCCQTVCQDGLHCVPKSSISYTYTSIWRTTRHQQFVFYAAENLVCSHVGITKFIIKVFKHMPQCEKPGSGTCRPSKVTHDVKDHVEQQMCLDESVSIAH